MSAGCPWLSHGAGSFAGREVRRKDKLPGRPDVGARPSHNRLRRARSAAKWKLERMGRSGSEVGLTSSAWLDRQENEYNPRRQGMGPVGERKSIHWTGMDGESNSRRLWRERDFF
jgi:hypothetical protein